MKTIKPILVLLFIALLQTSYAHTACTSCDLYFIANKGQWPSHIQYRSNFSAGSIFFHQQAVTFDLVNVEQKKKALRHGHYFDPNHIDSLVNSHAYKMSFVGANQNTYIQADNLLSEYFNYFIGNDKSKWASRVPAARKLIYREIYEGVDAEFYSVGIGLKYDLYVKPLADISSIAMQYQGVENMDITTSGDLVLKTNVGELIEQRPYAYQIINGKKREVRCDFVLNKENKTLRFRLGAYNDSYTLVIDPTLVFSTYSGSTADNFGYSATYDNLGNGFAAGSVFSTGYPVTLGAYQQNYVGGPTVFFTGGGSYPNTDIGITKVSADGTTRLFATYLGGFGSDLPHSLVVNDKDELYILGTTSSSNFPTTSLAFDTSYNGGTNPGVFDGIAAHYINGADITISKLSIDGTQLLASTYLGGSGNDGLNYNGVYRFKGTTRHNYADEVRGEIDIDKDGNVVVASCTRSSDFPRTSGTFQTAFGGGLDASFTKFKPDLDTLIWSTTFGGSGDDACYSVAFDKDNNLYFAGGTVSADFPMPGAGKQKTIGGNTDGFLYYVSEDGQNVLSSTFQGFADYDQIYFVEVNKKEEVMVLGQAENSQSKFIQNAIYNKPNGGQFISKFNKDLSSWIWSTSFGRGLGVTDISPTAFLADVCNSIYVCGWGSEGVNSNVQATGGTQGLDVTAGCVKCTTDNEEFYLMVLREDASALQYATYMGGNNSEEHVDGGTSRFDRKGVVYQSVCAGCGANSNFPTAPANAMSTTNNSNNCNNLIFKFDIEIPLTVADFTFPQVCNLVTFPFTNRSKQTSTIATYAWDFGDGITSSDPNPTHTYSLPGTYLVKLKLTDSASCNTVDSITKKIVVQLSASTIQADQTICSSDTIQIGIAPDGNPLSTYIWRPPYALSDPLISNPLASPDTTTNYVLLYRHDYCVDTVRQKIIVFFDSLSVSGGDVLCPKDTVRLTVKNTKPPALSYTWQPTSEILSGATSASPIVSPKKDTAFTVIGTDINGCKYFDTVRVKVASTLGLLSAIASPDTILYGDTSQITTSFPSSVVSFLWQKDSTLSALNIPDPKAFPLETTTYKLEVSDGDGCNLITDVTVVVLHTPCNREGVYIPNGFTPNSDGKNDKWYVRGNDIRKIGISVYDRWGQKVFGTNDIKEGWDGTFKGKSLDPSVFGWYVEGECISGDKFFLKGNLTLLR